MPEIVIPPVIDLALREGATLAVSISGGKDSQSMLDRLVVEHQRHDWPGRILAIHAHLGKAEWPQTLDHLRADCETLGVDLIEVHRPQGDLVDEIWARHDKLRGDQEQPAVPPWPDAKNRYCTSDQKRAQIDKVIRNPWPTSTMRYCTSDQKRDQLAREQRKMGEVVVSAMGIRAQESSARAKHSAVALSPRLTAKALVGLSPMEALSRRTGNERVVLEWLPIHDWREGDVWNQLGTSTEDLIRRQQLYRDGGEVQALNGWPAHPAYVWGNQRLSCAFCILGSKGDLINGMRHNPELYEEYVRIEVASGWKFRSDLALGDLRGAEMPAPRQAAQPGLL